jgi:hypothetical protein
MQRLFSYVTAMLGIAIFCVPASALAQAKPSRHLVYSFSVGVSNTATEHNSMFDGGTGIGTLGAEGSDKGQIMVDVNGVEPDGGLVVTVSEAARTNRSAQPATCVVYPDTSVVCGAGDVHPEEQSVIRTLSPKFFDASNLDANHHWQVTNAAANLKIDFTASPNADGVTVGITSDLQQKSTNGNSMQANGKYSYDTSKLIPTSLSEYQTIRQETGTGQNATIVIDTTATLVSDSGVAKS